MSPFISVIIVNYNAGDRLQKCVEHLEAQTFKDFEVLIIDNASKDGSAEMLKAPKINMTVNIAGENLGFAAGNNVMAKLHILGIAYRGYYGWNTRDLPEEGEVFAACGAAAFYKQQVFNKLNGFEERFFCYGEDVDLGYRHRLNGGRTIQLNRAIVYHEGSAITGRHSDFTIYHGHRNRIWFMYKNTPFWLYWPFLPLHIFANIYLFIRALIAGIGRPYLRAMLDGYRGAGQFKADRKAILKTRQGSYWFLLKSMEWSPFKIFSRRGRNWPYRTD